MPSSANATPLIWFRALLACRVVGEFVLGLAWLMAPAGLWSVVTQVRLPGGSPWLDPFQLLAVGGMASLLWSVVGAAAVLRCPTNHTLAWLAVGTSLLLSLLRLTLLRPLAVLWLAEALFGVLLAILLQKSSAPGERLGGRALASLGADLREVAQALWRWLRRPAVLAATAAVAVVMLAGGWVLWANLLRPAPEPLFASDEEHFKHAPLGNERSRGLPLYLWEVLPEVFADKLPGTNGWASFGFLFEPGRDVPVGGAIRTNGFPMISFNCALCHSGSYRRGDAEPRALAVGAPATLLDVNRVIAFLTECARDSRFTAAGLLPRIEVRHSLGWTERQTYRWIIIPAVRQALRLVDQEFSWTRLRAPAGPGRVDSINILKFNLLRFADDGSTGSTDYMSVWNQHAEAAYRHGWNGSGSGTEANLLAAAFLLNFDPRTFQQANYERMVRLLARLRPPAFPGPVDASVAARGQAVFERLCADCHGPNGRRVGQVISGTELGTDDHYLRVWRDDVAAPLREMNRGPFAFPTVVANAGFAALPLTGIWLRGPYLHNGSVPTVHDLLLPPDERPSGFFRGYDVLDLERLGFATTGPAAEKTGVWRDNRLPGNSARGHPYGTDLSEADRRALIEYLKTL